jgi:hypothetical protein
MEGHNRIVSEITLKKIPADALAVQQIENGIILEVPSVWVHLNLVSTKARPAQDVSIKVQRVSI